MRRGWIACAVAVTGHLVFLHAVSVWKPQTPGDMGEAGLPLLFVGLPGAPVGEDASANGKRGVGTQTGPLPRQRRVTPLSARFSNSASHQSKGSPPGVSPSENVDGMRFYASTEVDRQALPASALELLDVMALVANSSPITLRVYIGVDGAVVRAEIVRASDDNRAAAARLALILMQTRFIPAKRLGADVAAVRELEFQIEPSSEINRPASS